MQGKPYNHTEYVQKRTQQCFKCFPTSILRRKTANYKKEPHNEVALPLPILLKKLPHTFTGIGQQ
ncbi:hypothetical protein EV202_10378 [Bacteroides heparinolyticus]|uniref:Uncharacterized protein n=1 Tax=Prevotella heparinolytica TaxID=28113 RepID=A0A4R2M0N5_9BACE|nr:hypothetical protein EV202_10378 [Bacteroides heparinolyticus]